MEATDNGNHTESKGTSEDRTPNDVIQCSPESKTNPNQRQNLKCKLCKWESGLIKLTNKGSKPTISNIKIIPTKKMLKQKQPLSMRII